LDAAASTVVAFFAQVFLNAGSAVGLAALFKGVTDLFGDLSILLAAWTGGFLKVVVEAAAAYFQSLAEFENGEFGLGA
jgi:hypothetical protein